jgi:hypothetical protein
VRDQASGVPPPPTQKNGNRVQGTANTSPSPSPRHNVRFAMQERPDSVGGASRVVRLREARHLVMLVGVETLGLKVKDLAKAIGRAASSANRINAEEQLAFTPASDQASIELRCTRSASSARFGQADARVSMIFAQPPPATWAAWSATVAKLRPQIFEHSNS